MGHRNVDALILALATEGGMVLTADQLARAGVAWHLVRSREGGLLTRLSRGVYVVGEPTPDVLLRAVLASLPTGAAARRTAAGLHRLALPAVNHREVVAAQRSRLVLDGVHIRWTRWLPEDDVTRIDGLRVTTVARTLCDLASDLSRSRLFHLVEQSVTAQQVSVGEIQACLSAWCRKGRPGSGVVRALDHHLFDEEPMAASELERRGVRLLRRAGLTGWVGQYRPPWYDGVRGVVDLAWPEAKLVVELDGRRWHATTQALDNDRHRDRLAAAHGWVTLRFGWREVVHRPGTMIDECRALLAARQPAGP